YRNGVKVNATPVANGTDYLDRGAAANVEYTVRPVVGGAETLALAAAAPAAVTPLAASSRDVPISPPAGGTTPDGVSFTYSANDASVGDLDGDGQYEIVLKWDPSNSKDNSQSGY